MYVLFWFELWFCLILDCLIEKKNYIKNEMMFEIEK